MGPAREHLKPEPEPQPALPAGLAAWEGLAALIVGSARAGRSGLALGGVWALEAV